MITMLKQGGNRVPAISSDEFLSDVEDVRRLRDALMEMLEMILYDQDLTYCTPSDHLYIVAGMIRVLTGDLDRAAREES